MLLATVLSAWVQYAADGKPHARALVTHACPALTYSGRSVPMTLRAPAAPAANFNEAVCEAALPSDATAVAVEGRALPAPPRKVDTVIVFGDTGCRMKGGEQQNCGDIDNWPFPAIARSIAAVHADLAIHVGDYYYRENNCATALPDCVNYWGDTSLSWNADWFRPAAPIFASLPLVLMRGNHEDCFRGGAAWFRYLEPSAAASCPSPVTAADGTPPFAIHLPGLRLVVLDSASDARDNVLDPVREQYYQSAFDAMPALAAGAGSSTWLVTHRPPYANLNMTTVLKAKPADVGAFDAVIAGHVHDFATLNLTGYPPLIVNGESGDDLDDAGETEKFVRGNGFAFVDPKPFATKQFGFAVYTRSMAGWSISLRDIDGIERESCVLGHGDANIAAKATVACQ